ncbi:hypothetical protein M076_5068 [Bacteroides fragilis str. 2-F-2 |uniref:Uncharacterized protein n=1 Tax=Bacteroides fragilis str. 2-F-2 \|nr:hypothetical protein M076_5068 [Bacteroides fragilis str. 2-F-2 \
MIQLHTATFLAKLLLRRKEEFCKKYISSSRIKRDSRPLHLIKPNR